MSLSILLATRGRPELLKQTVETTVSNISRTDTYLYIACDSDDKPSIEVTESLAQAHKSVVCSIRHREDSLGAKYNRVVGWLRPNDVALAMVDYAPHITPGFDQKILDAAGLFEDGIGVVYNHLANLSFPQINAVTAKLVDAMGFMYPPYFPYWFVDHWLDDIARMIGRIAIADVWIDTSSRIETVEKPWTQERRDMGFWATLYDALVIERRNCAHRIIRSDEFKETEARKRLLMQDYSLIDERSKMLNENVRHMERQLNAMGVKALPADERYNRVKAEAMKHLRRGMAEIQADEASRKLNQAA